MADTQHHLNLLLCFPLRGQFVSVPTVSLDYQQSMKEKLSAYSSDINTLATVVPNMWAGAANGSDSKQEIEKAKQRIRKKIPVVQNAVSYSGLSFFGAKL